MFHREESRELACRRCDKPLAEADFEFDRALMLLGRPYCAGCLKDVGRRCRLCRKSLRQADFESGRALTLGNSLYCDGCLEEALRTTRPATVLPPSVAQRLAELRSGDADLDPAPAAGPAPRRAVAAAALPPEPAPEPDWESRRTSVRFVPPLDCVLSLRPTGIKNLLAGSVVRLWVDVSEGGLRAVLEGRYGPGEDMRGKLSHPSLKVALSFRAEVRHGKASEKFPGCTLVGVKFQNPSAVLVAFIRDVLGRHISMVSLKSRKPRKPSPPSRSA